MAEAIPDRAGQSPAISLRNQIRREEQRDNAPELLAAISQADVRPTMAEAIPERAGQSPAISQRRQRGREEERDNGSELPVAISQANALNSDNIRGQS